MQNFSFLACLEVAEKFVVVVVGWGGVVGWSRLSSGFSFSQAEQYRMVESTNLRYFSLEAKTEKLQKINNIFFHFWPPGQDVDNSAFDQYICLTEITFKENPCSLKLKFSFSK